MNLAIFGGSGRTGQVLVQQALAAGHTVHALVRNQQKLPLQHPTLLVLQGDVLDATAVERTVAPADAVLSLLGHESLKGTQPNLQCIATDHMIAAMRKQGVRRIITLTGGVPVSEDRPKLADRLIWIIVQAVAPTFKDAKMHVELLQRSGLDWTVVRGPRSFTDGPLTATYRVGWVGVGTGTSVARANLADFMLKQVNDSTYLHKAPIVSD